MSVLENNFILIALTFATFMAAKWVQRRTGWVLFNPILITIAVLILYLKVKGISYDT